MVDSARRIEQRASVLIAALLHLTAGGTHVDAGEQQRFSEKFPLPSSSVHGSGQQHRGELCGLMQRCLFWHACRCPWPCDLNQQSDCAGGKLHDPCLRNFSLNPCPRTRQVLEVTIWLANDAVKGMQRRDPTAQLLGGIEDVMGTCIAIIHCQLDKHGAQASTAQLQVITRARACCAYLIH